MNDDFETKLNIFMLHAVPHVAKWNHNLTFHERKHSIHLLYYDDYVYGHIEYETEDILDSYFFKCGNLNEPFNMFHPSFFRMSRKK